MADLTFNENFNELANSERASFLLTTSPLITIANLLRCSFLVVVTSCTITTLLIYDHLLTLGREVTNIWSRGWSRPCILFFLIRYMALLYAILLVFFHGPFPGSPISTQTCQEVIVTRLVLFTASFVFAAVFPGLRVYALCQRKWIAILVFFFGIACPLDLLIQAVQSIPRYSPLGVCRYRQMTSVNGYKSYHIAARVSTMVADTIVLVLTWIWGRGDSVLFWRSSTMSRLRRRILLDTLKYSGMVLLVHVASLAMIQDVLYVTEMAQWIQVVIVISTTRFMLDLHQAARPHDDTEMSCAALSIRWGVEQLDDDLNSFEGA